MKKILLISLSMLFATEMEVDGGLTVTGQVNASSFSGDGSALTNLPSLGGMKPERIYIKNVDWNSGGLSLTVPTGKFWFVTTTMEYGQSCNIDGQSLYIALEGKPSELYVLNSINCNNFDNGAQFAIFEYSISGSGTDQGMDYVIP